VWKGKVTKGNGFGKQSFKLELKLIKTGDSLVGTSYYYASPNNYFRYSIKGYFDSKDNSVNWWDDQLIENKSGGLSLGSVNHLPMTAEADFNCPGSGIMKLDGNIHPKDGGYNYEIHMDKYPDPSFKDEWDPIIEDYFYGGADPVLIDSVSKIALKPKPVPHDVAIVAPSKPKPVVHDVTIVSPPQPKPVVVSKPTPDKPKVQEPKPEPKPVIVRTETPKPVIIPEPVVQKPEPVIAYVPPPTVEEKFIGRKNVLTTEIPVTADSIEFRFYDNAEVDGDSISIFLNKKLINTHIRLTTQAFSMKVAKADLMDENELVMVAENLGSIPPNTAYMEAWNGTIRYTARLESTETSSAMIKLMRR